MAHYVCGPVDTLYYSHCLTILEYFVSLNRYASDSGLSSEMENSSEMTRIEPSTEIKSEWTKRSERDEMKARMITPPPSPFFYASTRLGGIHRGLFVERGRKWGLRYLPSSFTPSFISGCRRSYALHRKIAKGVCVLSHSLQNRPFNPLPYLLSSFIGHTLDECILLERSPHLPLLPSPSVFCTTAKK